jgi:hypothetical protein
MGLRGLCGWVRNTSPPPEFKPPSIQSVTRRYSVLRCEHQAYGNTVTFEFHSCDSEVGIVGRLRCGQPMNGIWGRNEMGHIGRNSRIGNTFITTHSAYD